MANKNSFGGSKWFTIRSVGVEKTQEIGVFKATTPNQLKVKLQKVLDSSHDGLKLPDNINVDDFTSTQGGAIYLYQKREAFTIIVSETKLF